MSVLRQLNVLGQQRLDVPHIRSIESSIAADFDVVAGRVQGGGKALVIRGFTLANFTSGTTAASIQLSTADGIIYNMNASEAGTFLWVPADRAVEVLNSATNSRVQGSFTAGQTNYIGVDLLRSADDTTSDLVQFLDPNTLLEQAKNVPLARTLDYRIVISTTPFSAASNIIPIAKVKTDSQNQVDTPTNAVEDARNIMWRLGSGGDFPNIYGVFAWPQNRVEYDPNVSALSGLAKFSGGDKGLKSQKDWMDAVMMRLWEVGGGQNWYSPTADRNVKMTKSPGVVFGSTADNFEWVSGLYASTHLHWQGIKVLFENANISGVYYNTVADQLSDDGAGSAALSKTALAIGDCIYVDLDRTQNATVIAKKAATQTLGTGAVPGSRVVLAWRDTSGYVFVRDNSFAVNTSFSAATTVAIGAVRLSYAAGVPATPTVPPLDANNAISIGTGSYLISGNNYALTLVGGGTFAGLHSTGGSSNGDGILANGVGTGAGIKGIGGATAPAGFATRTSGTGGNFTGGVSGANGVVGQGGSASTIGTTALNYSNIGLYGIGTGGGSGVVGLSPATDGTAGVVGEGSDGVNSNGVSGTGKGSGAGGTFSNPGTGRGVVATGGSGTSGSLGIGGDFTGGGQYGIRATATAGLFAAHAILAQASNSGGSYGVKSFGGDLNAGIATDDTTFNVGYGAGGVFIAGQQYGGVGVAGYGGGTTGSNVGSLSSAAQSQGGYFVGAASAFGGTDGVMGRGGANTGSLGIAGTGIVGYGGSSNNASQASGHGGYFRGGAMTAAGTAGSGVNAAGGAATASGTGGRGATLSGGNGFVAGGQGANVTGGAGLGTTSSPGGLGLNVTGGSQSVFGADAGSVGGDGIHATGGSTTNTNSRGGHGGVFTGGTGNPNASPYQVGGHGVVGLGANSSHPGIGVIGLAAGLTTGAGDIEVFNETPQGAGVYGLASSATYYGVVAYQRNASGTALYAAANAGSSSYGAAAYFSGGGFGTGSGQRQAVTIYQLNPSLNPAYACLGTSNGTYGIDATGNAIPIAMGSRTVDPSGIGTLLEGSFWLDRNTSKINCVMNGVIKRTVALT